MNMKKIPRVHVLSETVFHLKGNGVHTAFMDSLDLLRSGQDLDVVVNGEGWGDLLHSHTNGPYYFWKGLRYRGRRILTVHVTPDSLRGTLWIYSWLRPLVRWYLTQAYTFADVCIAISPVVEQTLRKLKAKTRIVKIYNPIHAEKFLPTAERRAAGRRWLGVADRDFVVLSAGQIHNRKGVDDFLDIAEACPEFTFIWAGGQPFGPMTEGAIKTAKRINNMGPHVRFIGDVSLERMPWVYNAADLFVFPSYQENCPLAPMEAAAAHLPVVFRDLPEYGQLYQHPYWKAANTAEFVRIIRRTAWDPAFREQGREHSKDLLKQFAKDEIRKQLIALYEEMLQEPLRVKNAAGMAERPRGWKRDLDRAYSSLSCPSRRSEGQNERRG